MNLRKFASKIYRKSEYVLKVNISALIRNLTLKSNGSIVITFEANSAVDGTGAQLQRLISVYAFAKYFGFKYEHSGIKQVSVHALDPFQTEELYIQYLEELNAFIQFSNMEKRLSLVSEFQNYKIKFWKFMFLLLKNRLRPNLQKFSVLEPYPITEFSPGALPSIRNVVAINSRRATSVPHPYIALHYRQGVGGFVLYPGQNISRETPLIQFEEVLKGIINNSPSPAALSLVILTDAPTSITYYEPPLDQQHLWIGTPGFTDGKMEIQPLDFEYLSQRFDLPIKVIRGGNPLDAIEIMAEAEYLLMGKSSLSYVAGLLNKSGKIYSPRNFWHRPLPGWRKF